MTETAEAAEASTDDLMERVVRLCRTRGFIFPSAEIYGGFRSTYDYGPLGVNMLRNVKNAWWRSMVQLRDDVVGLDAAILGPPAGAATLAACHLFEVSECFSGWKQLCACRGSACQDRCSTTAGAIYRFPFRGTGKDSQDYSPGSASALRDRFRQQWT